MPAVPYRSLVSVVGPAGWHLVWEPSREALEDLQLVWGFSCMASHRLKRT